MIDFLKLSKKENPKQLKIYRLVLCPHCNFPNPPFFPLLTEPSSRYCYECKHSFTLKDAKNKAHKKNHTI